MHSIPECHLHPLFDTDTSNFTLFFTDFNTTKKEKIPNAFTSSSTDFSFLRKKVVSSAYVKNKKLSLKNCRPLMFGFAIIKVKITSNAKMKRYAEIGSPFLVPRSS